MTLHDPTSMFNIDYFTKEKSTGWNNGKIKFK